ncbi:hypothetical protein [Streptomyces sp. KMM 9044]|uniref:hypothetical protein n=1 Tax=Streptomyces sp. KMM 9044 TaxID=2744474 RepID=UPI002151D57B|nr:hypothetical protein [Streptomyces sp. KMM 9044]WAX82157.1 hypothetical protein HUV60_002075 [Streptomyces sp. KMM 9044]WAX82169.1 hypothetical protein HUV60_013655 [Streptomyces sp. KMM 9044]
MSTERAVQVWAGWFDDFFAGLAGVFGRVEPRLMAMAYRKALVAPVERKNGWVRHEAPCDRVEVGDLYRRAVAAAG